jgi:hypothetical protein
VTGTIAGINGNVITISTLQSQQSAVRITPETALDKVVSGNPSDLKVGDFVLVIGELDQSGNVDAASITIGGAGLGFGP